MAPTEQQLIDARAMVAAADGATAASSLNARRSTVYPVCHCNASTLPHRHAHDGIVDVDPTEQLPKTITRRIA